MNDQVYTISQAAKEVGESTSVLRYWEEVLELRVNRNKKGYRCYTGYDIQLFLNIKELKKRGLKLEAIRELIPRIYQYGPGAPKSKTRLLEDAGDVQEIEDIQDIQDEEILESQCIQEDDELQEIQEIEIIEEIGEIRETGCVQEDEIQEQAMEAGQNERGTVPLQFSHMDDLRLTEFQNIMEKLIAQGIKEKNQEELRIRKLDEKIRFHQQSLKQVAAAHEIKQRRGMGRRRKK